jgi:hypothetical protein
MARRLYLRERNQLRNRRQLEMVDVKMGGSRTGSRVQIAKGLSQSL